MTNPTTILLTSALALGGCALSNHATELAQLPLTPVSSFDDLVKARGPIQLTTVVSAKWAVPLSGLLDLEDPKAKEAGLTDMSTPIVLPVHVLVHPERGMYVVDSGVSKDRVNGGRGAARTGVEYFARDIQPMVGLADIIAEQGRPLAGVLLTHMHVDHVLGIHDLPPETVIYSGPGELSASSFLHVFLRTTYDALLDGRAPLKEFDFANAPRVGPIRGAIDLLGDGSLFALSVPGHTPGSTAYLANTTDGPVLLTGDTSHTLWGWEHGVTPGSYTADHESNRESLAALKALVAAHPEIRVFVGHELDGEDTGVRGAQRKLAGKMDPKLKSPAADVSAADAM